MCCVQGKHFEEDQLKLWLAELLTAMDYMHSKSVLHRDIKTQVRAAPRVVGVGSEGAAQGLGVGVGWVSGSRRVERAARHVEPTTWAPKAMVWISSCCVRAKGRAARLLRRCGWESDQTRGCV